MLVVCETKLNIENWLKQSKMISAEGTVTNIFSMRNIKILTILF